MGIRYYVLWTRGCVIIPVPLYLCSESFASTVVCVYRCLRLDNSNGCPAKMHAIDCDIFFTSHYMLFTLMRLGRCNVYNIYDVCVLRSDCCSHCSLLCPWILFQKRVRAVAHGE